MSTKIISLDERFATGEPTVQLVVTPGRGGRMLREQTSLHMSKTASRSPAMDYIRHVEPAPGKTIVLVIGLGDDETYGANRNGDGFPSEPVPGKIDADQVLTKHYKSYENAHVFKHHVNNDPAKAIGKVLKVFWNPFMRRVEVLEDFDHDKGGDLLTRIGDGEFPAKSMGCFQAGTMITLGDGTRKEIENVSVGDQVLTHEGRTRVVTELHRRSYSGDVFTVRADSQEPVVCTGNHPFLVVDRADVRDATRSGFAWARPEDVTLNPMWVEARCLDADEHLLLCPIDRYEQTPDYADRAFARLLGYYLAKGHTYWRNGEPYGVQLTVHRDDAVLSEIDDLCKAYGTRNTPVVTQHPVSESARYVQINDPRLAALCVEHAGVGARTKRLSESCMHWDPAVQREMLGAYANGDGHSPSQGAQRGTLRLSTASRGLGEQLTALSHRLGLVPSVNCITHRAGKGFSACDTYEYVLHYGKAFAQSLRDVCQKITPLEAFVTKHTRRIYGNYVVLPIRTLDAYTETLNVYNFEVEEDESYVAGGVVAHNCKIPYDVCRKCGNRAPTRKQYCDHLLYAMGHINEDGTQNAALNPSPKFFDSSWVFRPADRNGFMLKKVAYDRPYEIRTASYELAELVLETQRKSAALGKAAVMEKVISGGTPEATATGTDRGSLKLVKNYADKVAPSEARNLPSTDVRITIEYTPDEAVGTTDAMGLPMGLRELISYFMGRMGDTPTAPTERELDCACKHAEVLLELFAEYPRFYDDCVKTAGLSDLRVNAKLASAVAASERMPNPTVASTGLGRTRMPYFAEQETPNTDVLTYTDAHGHTARTNMGAARQATEALADRARVEKGARGAGYLGLGTVLGGAGLGAIVTGGRSPVRRLAGAGLLGTGLVAGGKGVHEAVRPVRVGDLDGPKVLTNEGVVIPAATQMKGASWQPDMLYTVLRTRDSVNACAPLAPARKLAMLNEARSAEIWDEQAAQHGPTLHLEKIALLVEQSILSLTETP